MTFFLIQFAVARL